MQAIPVDIYRQLHRRVGPILRTYAGRSGRDDWGDPGEVTEGEDESIIELKTFWCYSRRSSPGDLVVRGRLPVWWRRRCWRIWRRGLRKGKRTSEAAGYEPRKLKLLAPLGAEKEFKKRSLSTVRAGLPSGERRRGRPHLPALWTSLRPPHHLSRPRVRSLVCPHLACPREESRARVPWKLSTQMWRTPRVTRLPRGPHLLRGGPRRRESHTT